MTAHHIRWFGILPDGERVPRNQHMNGGDWGWDATCSCGWDSRTGGAIQERIREAIADHRLDAAYDDVPAWERERAATARAALADLGTLIDLDHELTTTPQGATP